MAPVGVEDEFEEGVLVLDEEEVGVEVGEDVLLLVVVVVVVAVK